MARVLCSGLACGSWRRISIQAIVTANRSSAMPHGTVTQIIPADCEAVFDLIRKAVSRRGTTTVLVTHSERLARRCDRVYVMEEGALKNLTGSSYKFGLESPAIPI